MRRFIIALLLSLMGTPFLGAFYWVCSADDNKYFKALDKKLFNDGDMD